MAVPTHFAPCRPETTADRLEKLTELEGFASSLKRNDAQIYLRQLSDIRINLLYGSKTERQAALQAMESLILTFTSHECSACFEKCRLDQIVGTDHCEHSYCQSCLETMIKLALRDKSSYPPSCCKKPLDRADMLSKVSPALASTYFGKIEELEDTRPTYCHIPTCSTYIGEANKNQHIGKCPTCRSGVCLMCKQAEHEGECPEKEEVRQIRELAGEQGWQWCPGCRQPVELSGGCNHMTCECETQFCYLCSSLWKTCRCPQFGIRQEDHEQELRRVLRQGQDPLARAEAANEFERWRLQMMQRQPEQLIETAAIADDHHHNGARHAPPLLTPAGGRRHLIPPPRPARQDVVNLSPRAYRALRPSERQLRRSQRGFAVAERLPELTTTNIQPLPQAFQVDPAAPGLPGLPPSEQLAAQAARPVPIFLAPLPPRPVRPVPIIAAQLPRRPAQRVPRDAVERDRMFGAAFRHLLTDQRRLAGESLERYIERNWAEIQRLDSDIPAVGPHHEGLTGRGPGIRIVGDHIEVPYRLREMELFRRRQEVDRQIVELDAEARRLADVVRHPIAANYAEALVAISNWHQQLMSTYDLLHLLHPDDTEPRWSDMKVFALYRAGRDMTMAMDNMLGHANAVQSEAVARQTQDELMNLRADVAFILHGWV